ncbi:MAG TPA: metalloregulator ArsR/SmtB family transcription factor [Synergistaceae bacterium]|nr:metalloregulator ArsR/SmtB family transcription factor [Synergistaceae bacterium]
MSKACPCPEENCIHQQRLEQARNNAPSEEIRRELARMFRALGDPTRMGILLVLREGEMCVRDLAIFLEISESAVSHQLRLLRDLYMVQPRREGQIIFYSLRDRHVEEILRLGLVHFLHEKKEESEAFLR